MAAGPLSTPNIPDFPGINDFKGETYHTGMWPKHAVSFAGKRVVQIGTGSSGVQIAQEISKDAARHYVLQRTAHHIIPARNRPLYEGEQEEIKARYPELREFWQTLIGATFYQSLPSDPPLVPGNKSIFDVTPEERKEIFDNAWAYGGYGFQRAFTDTLKTIEASTIAGDYIADRIRETVKDPAVAEKLISSQYFGTKRVILDTNYYEIFNQDNVELVDVKSDPIARITEKGMLLESGREIEADMIVFATGFDAMTGSLTRMDIAGRGGKVLRDAWKDGPASYLGIMVHGFPGMFVIGGPQSCSALGQCHHRQRTAGGLDLRGDLLARRARLHLDRADAARRRKHGSTAATNWPTRRSIPRATAGISAPIFPASRAASCSMSPVIPATRPRPRKSPPRAMKASFWRRPRR